MVKLEEVQDNILSWYADNLIDNLGCFTLWR